MLGTIKYGTSTSLTITGNYSYIGIRSSSGALYLTNITFTWGEKDTATNLSNYIMYEDTNEQCTTKFATAKGYFEALSLSERNTFMSSNDYVISTARERFEAWARNRGQNITYVNNDYVLSSIKVPMLEMISGGDNITLLTVIIVILTTSATCLCFHLKRKKR